MTTEIRPLDLAAINLAEWDEWNAGITAAREAYTQDRQTEAGLCITCDNPRASGRRECWPCWDRRMGRVKA